MSFTQMESREEMDHSTLQDYIRKIKSMNRSRSRSNGYAPHNPFLMLAVIELMEQGKISDNRILPSDDLIAIFGKYILLIPGSNSTIPESFIPESFYDLKNEGFWDLENWLPISGSQMNLFSSVEQMALPAGQSVRQLQNAGAYAVLDDDLFSFLKEPVYSELIRQTIIETYFPELRQRIEEFAVEESAKDYSKTLISGAEKPFLLYAELIEKVKPPVRSAGFRRAIMLIYDYTCAICKLNIRAPSGESVTDAAHIIPFSVSGNDDIRNGMSLCKLHHWAFDTGLISVNEAYRVIVSPSATESMLTGLDNREILLPREPEHRPAREALAWHREQVMKR